MKQRHPQARQKMSRIIDEIGAALFACGATEVSLRLKKEPEGLRLLVQSMVVHIRLTVTASAGCRRKPLPARTRSKIWKNLLQRPARALIWRLKPV